MIADTIVKDRKSINKTKTEENDFSHVVINVRPFALVQRATPQSRGRLIKTKFNNVYVATMDKCNLGSCRRSHAIHWIGSHYHDLGASACRIFRRRTSFVGGPRNNN